MNIWVHYRAVLCAVHSHSRSFLSSFTVTYNPATPSSELSVRTELGTTIRKKHVMREFLLSVLLGLTLIFCLSPVEKGKDLPCAVTPPQRPNSSDSFIDTLVCSLSLMEVKEKSNHWESDAQLLTERAASSVSFLLMHCWNLFSSHIYVLPVGWNFLFALFLTCSPLFQMLLSNQEKQICTVPNAQYGTLAGGAVNTPAYNYTPFKALLFLLFLSHPSLVNPLSTCTLRGTRAVL